ncbi:aldo/keto reductase [Streptomyces sp. NPDC002553]|uniref:aldo/keto reductase n=1 Tax=Streptomyces sp. NPDC002553 TaxID=3154417 RepID=UPI00332BF2C1
MTSDVPGGQIEVAGMQVSRLGLSTMQLAGRGAWGAPPDWAAAMELLRAAVFTYGITHLDTSDAYGPHVVEELIREALHPYPEGLLIATTVGMVRPTRDHWVPLGKPAYLRAAVEMSLRRLRVERLDLCYLHQLDPEVEVADQIGTLETMRCEGKIGYIGLVNAPPADLRWAARYGRVDVVQGPLSLFAQDDPLLELCREGAVRYVASPSLDHRRQAQHLRAALHWLRNHGDQTAVVPATSSLNQLHALVEAVSASGLQGDPQAFPTRTLPGRDRP